MATSGSVAILRRSLLLSIPVWAVAIADAQAACTPATPTSGQTVTCTGTEPNGFVQPTNATGLTVNVQQGASITGSRQTGGTNATNATYSSVLLRDGSTINNNGLIVVNDATAKIRDNYGVNFVGNNITLNNNANGVILLSGGATFTGRLYGAYTSSPSDDVEFDNINIVNNGIISVTMNGNGRAIGIYGGENIGDFTITNYGTISAVRGATSTLLTQSVAAFDSDDDVEEYRIINAAGGRITASGVTTRAINGRAILFDIENYGTIANLTPNATNSAAIATYTGTTIAPYRTVINNYGTITGDIRNTDTDNQTAPGAGLAVTAAGANQRRTGAINNYGTITGNLLFGSGNQEVLNAGTITGNITFLDAATTAARAGSVNTLTLLTGSSLTGAITARGAGDNTLFLSNTATPGGGGGGDDDDDDDDAAAPAAVTGTGTGSLRSNVTGFTRLILNGGTWTLEQGTTQRFSAGAVIQDGTLIVNSNLFAPSVSVLQAGTLGGTGTITGNLANGGIVAPGSTDAPYGTLRLTGNYTQSAAGQFSVAGTADGTQNARMLVTGTASLGGDLQFRAGSGVYRPGTTYTVLTATGGVSGRFASTSQTGLPTLLRPTASYDANDAYLTITQGSFTQVARTGNQRAAAAGLDAALAGRTDVLVNLDYRSDAQLSAILDRVAGQGYASLADPQMRSGRSFTDMLMQRGYAGIFEAAPGGITLPPAMYAADPGRPAPVPEPRFVPTSRGYSVWATGYGQFGQVGTTVNAAGRNERLAGLAAGIDAHPTIGSVLGIAVGYGAVDVALSRTGERAHTDNAQIGVYGGLTSGAFYGTIAAGYAHADGRVTRSLGGLQDLQPSGANGRISGDQFLSAGEVGLRYAYAAQKTVSPFVGYQVATFSRDAVRETGGLFDLNVASQDYVSARSLVGARVEDTTVLSGGQVLGFGIRAAYVHDFADVARSISASFALAPAVPFTVQGVRLDRNRALVGVGLGMLLAPGLVGFVNYDAEVAASDSIQAVRGGARYTF